MDTTVTGCKPGSREAFLAGCSCPTMDNHYGRGVGGYYWVNGDCKIHGVGLDNHSEDAYNSPTVEQEDDVAGRTAVVPNCS